MPTVPHAQAVVVAAADADMTTEYGMKEGGTLSPEQFERRYPSPMPSEESLGEAPPTEYGMKEGGTLSPEEFERRYPSLAPSLEPSGQAPHSHTSIRLTL